LLNAEGQVYQWPREGLKYFGECLVAFPNGVKIKDVGVGSGFVVCRESHGLLYSYGSNDCGELGHGDLAPRQHPTLV
jgi:alpha-tubulin suppressor-like RCC1 family protein